MMNLCQYFCWKLVTEREVMFGNIFLTYGPMLTKLKKKKKKSKERTSKKEERKKENRKKKQERKKERKILA